MADDLNKAIEEAGKFNKKFCLLFFLCSVTGFFNVWHIFIHAFQSSDIPFWCTIPALKSTNWTNEEIRELTSTKGGCEYYDYNYDELSTLSFNEAKERTSGDKPKTIQCEEYSYESPETSLVADWDLVCGRLALKSTAQAVVTIGKFLGALIFGVVADRYGRRVPIFISLIIYIVFAYIPGFIPWYEGLVFARFFLGMAGAGCYNCAFTLLTESCNIENRTRVSILYNLPYPLGLLLLTLAAYFERNWRNLQIWIAIPGVILISHFFLLTESARWYMIKGKNKKAWKVVKYYNSNLTPASEPEDTPVEQGPKFKDKTKKFFELCIDLELVFRLIICSIMWFITALGYMAITLSASNLKIDIYIFQAMSAVAEMVSYFYPILLLKFLGRKVTCAGLYFLVGIVSLAMSAAPQGKSEVILPLAIIGKLANAGVYAIMVLYTSELFPTENRNAALGISSVMSQVGSSVAPYIVDLLGAINWTFPNIIIAVTSILTGLATMFLPETKGRDLPDTMDDLHQQAKGGDKVSIVNLCKFK